MKFVNRLTTSYRLAIELLRQPRYLLRFVFLWLIVLGIFLWINRINLLIYIFTQSPLSVVDKILFVMSAYLKALVYALNPIVFSTLVFSLLTSLNLVLLTVMVRLDSGVKRVSGSQAGALGAAAGSHILSCGGTLLLSPLFPALAGAGAVISEGPGVGINVVLATFANLIGIAIMIRSINKMSNDVTMRSQVVSLR